MGMSIRVSSLTSGGTATAVSLGGRPAATGPSTSNGGFFDDVTTAQNDAGHTDYRVLFIYNNGSTVMNDVKVSPNNAGGGSSVTIAASSVATSSYASYQTTTIASETTAPPITGSFAASVSIGTLNAGQVKAVWLKRVTGPRAAATSADTCTITVSANEVQ